MQITASLVGESDISNTPTDLRRWICRSHGSEQLQDLGFDLGVEYHRLPGEGKTAKVRELLLLYLGRRREREPLLGMLWTLPGQSWDVAELYASLPAFEASTKGCWGRTTPTPRPASNLPAVPLCSG
jgi:hypothetical protein